MRKGCDALRKCEDMIGKLGLFSANETKEDISTGNLKYILVSFGVNLILFIFSFFNISYSRVNTASTPHNHHHHNYNNSSKMVTDGLARRANQHRVFCDTDSLYLGNKK